MCGGHWDILNEYLVTYVNDYENSWWLNPMNDYEQNDQQIFEVKVDYPNKVCVFELNGRG